MKLGAATVKRMTAMEMVTRSSMSVKPRGSREIGATDWARDGVDLADMGISTVLPRLL